MDHFILWQKINASSQKKNNYQGEWKSTKYTIQISENQTKTKPSSNSILNTCCTSGSVLNLSLVWNWRKNPDATGTKFETALSRNVEAWTAAASIDDAKRASLASRRFQGLSWTPLGRFETQPVD